MREDALQRAVMEWLALELPALAERTLHVPNGGRRGKAEAGRFKAMGVRAGFPDMLTLFPRGRYHGAALELKAGRRKPTVAQNEWLARLARDGYAAGWANSMESAQGFYRRYWTGTLVAVAAAG